MDPGLPLMLAAGMKKTSDAERRTKVFKLLFATSDSRNHALNLAGLEALGAHTNANVLSVDSGANRLEVRAEGALIADM